MVVPRFFLVGRWIRSDWQYTQIFSLGLTICATGFLIKETYAVIQHDDGELASIAVWALLLMSGLSGLLEGPAQGRSRRRRTRSARRLEGNQSTHPSSAPDRKPERSKLHGWLYVLRIVGYLLGAFMLLWVAFITAVVFGLPWADDKLSGLPSYALWGFVGLMAVLVLREVAARLRQNHRLGFNPDFYVAVDRRVSEEDRRPELLVHRHSDDVEHSGWCAYADEQVAAEQDLVTWSMKDLINHSPEATGPLREGHGTWKWDQARQAYFPLGQRDSVAT